MAEGKIGVREKHQVKRHRNHCNKDRRIFLKCSSAMLIFAASMKAMALVLDYPGPSDPDPVIWFLPKNILSVGVIGLESWVAVYVLSWRRLENQYAAVLLLSSAFLGYRLTKWLYFRDSICECLGSIFASLGYGFLDYFAFAMAVALFSGSLIGILKYNFLDRVESIE